MVTISLFMNCSEVASSYMYLAHIFNLSLKDFNLFFPDQMPTGTEWTKAVIFRRNFKLMCCFAVQLLGEPGKQSSRISQVLC